MGAQGPPPEVVRLLKRLELIELERGAVVGVGAHLFGYLATLLVLVGGERGYDPTWTVSETGQLLYNAMFVPVEQPVAGGTAPGFDASRNVLTDETLAEAFVVPTLVYHAIPVIVLVAGGVVLSRWVGAQTPASGAIAGLSVGVGGLLFAITGTLVFSNNLGSPAFFESVVLVGLVFPGICGALGGAVTGTLAQRDHHG